MITMITPSTMVTQRVSVMTASMARHGTRMTPLVAVLAVLQVTPLKGHDLGSP
jgi:hypothetical protein